MNLAWDDYLVVSCLVGTMYDYIHLNGGIRILGIFGVVGLRVVGLTLVSFVGAFLLLSAIGPLVAQL